MDARLPISVLLLVRDEVADLEQLLPTLGFASEVVVVRDPRGDERVRTTAERLGARVLDRAFDGFGPQRAFALAACRHEWVLWLDADERLDAEAVAELAGALRDAGPAPPRRRS
ncbi:MAG: glycosyltransferase, partial [bacterium]